MLKTGTVNKYSVRVANAMSLGEMVEAGQFDGVNQEIVSSNFQSATEPAEEETTIYVIKSGTPRSTFEQVLTEGHEQGLQPANLWQILALRAKYPLGDLFEQNRTSGIISPIPWKNRFQWYKVPGIWRHQIGNNIKYHLRLDGIYGDWSQWGFAMVPLT